MSESEGFGRIMEIFSLKEIDFIDFFYDCIRKETGDLFFDESLILPRYHHVKVYLILVRDILQRKGVLSSELVEDFP